MYKKSIKIAYLNKNNLNNNLNKGKKVKNYHNNSKFLKKNKKSITNRKIQVIVPSIPLSQIHQ